MTWTTTQDAELLRLMAAGDEQAFTALYRRYQANIYRFALLMTGRRNNAEEVTQDVFLTLFREPHRYDPSRGLLVAYLYGVARNCVRRMLKKEGVYVPLIEDSELEMVLDPFVSRADPFADCSRNELVRLVREAVLTLPTRYREVVVICDFQEMSCADAALMLGCAVGTVNSRLHRGHAMLLKKLRGRSELNSQSERAQQMRCFA